LPEVFEVVESDEGTTLFPAKASPPGLSKREGCFLIWKMMMDYLPS